MSAENYFGNCLLVAMPQMADPNFSHTVTYICEHSEEGALGIVINRPMALQLEEMLDQFDLADATANIGNVPVFLGGPVQQERGFVLHDVCGDFEATIHVGEQFNLTSSRDILDAIAAGNGPDEYIVALGYAGWSAGQLEAEVLENSWLVLPAERAIVFDTPADQRWEAAVRTLGVEPGQLSGEAGHG